MAGTIENRNNFLGFSNLVHRKADLDVSFLKLGVVNGNVRIFRIEIVITIEYISPVVMSQ